jgi:AAA family ATP:ADP antiporter
LFLPCSREAKYKAKAAIDTFFQRAGDVLSSGVVYTRAALALSVTVVAGVNLVLTLVWLAIAVGIAREYLKRAKQEPGALAAAATPAAAVVQSGTA